MNINEIPEQEFLEALIKENEASKKNITTILPKYKADINTWLTHQTEENLQKLISIIDDSMVREEFYTDTQIGFLILAVTIYKNELKHNIPTHIFTFCHSLDELQELFTLFKHLLWRTEFHTDDSNGTDFLSFISVHNLSPFCVEIFVENLSFKKIDMLKFFASFFYENNCLNYALPFIDVLKNYVKGVQTPDDTNQ